MTLLRWVLAPRNGQARDELIRDHAIPIRGDVPYLNYLSRQGDSVWITVLVPNDEVNWLERRYVFGDPKTIHEKSTDDPMLWLDAAHYARCLHDTTSLAIDLLTTTSDSRTHRKRLMDYLETPDPPTAGMEAYFLEHSPVYQRWSPAQRDEYWSIATLRGPHPAMSPPTHWFLNLL
jgi:hypothetical protein